MLAREFAEIHDRARVCTDMVQLGTVVGWAEAFGGQKVAVVPDNPDAWGPTEDVGGWASYSWSCHTTYSGRFCLIAVWQLTVQQPGKRADNSHYPHKCGCGAAAYVGAVPAAMACSSPTCRHYDGAKP